MTVRGAWNAARGALVDPLLALVFSAPCVGCEGPLDEPSRGPLCGACRAVLSRPFHACACGCPLASPQVAACGRCRRGLSPHRTGASLGSFAGPLRAAVHALKYGDRHGVVAPLVEALLTRPEAAAALTGDILLVPVPLHPQRQAQRGFNQAELLAQAVARRTCRPVAPRALARRRDTPAQTGLSAAARRVNVTGAFECPVPAVVKGRTIVLVDDVMTTGATLRACSATLLRAGAAEVRVLTLARA